MSSAELSRTEQTVDEWIARSRRRKASLPASDMRFLRLVVAGAASETAVSTLIGMFVGKDLKTGPRSENKNTDEECEGYDLCTRNGS